MYQFGTNCVHHGIANVKFYAVEIHNLLFRHPPHIHVASIITVNVERVQTR